MKKILIIIKIHTANIDTPNFTKQALSDIKGKISPNTIIMSKVHILALPCTVGQRTTQTPIDCSCNSGGIHIFSSAHGTIPKPTTFYNKNQVLINNKNKIILYLLKIFIVMYLCVSYVCWCP